MAAKLQYVYDGRNRLKSIVDADGNRTEWQYNDVTLSQL